MKLIDISRDLTTAEVYPGDPQTVIERIRTIGSDSDCNLTAAFMCLHTGTHIDAPMHFIDNGDDATAYDPEIFFGPCTVIEIKDSPITGEFIDRHFPKNAERVLIKGNGEVTFMGSSAEEASKLGLKLIGTDAASVGVHGDQIKPHKSFLMNGTAILEGLDLSEVEPGNYFLIAFPLKISGVDGAPVRAFLADEYIFWTKK